MAMRWLDMGRSWLLWVTYAAEKLELVGDAVAVVQFAAGCYWLCNIQVLPSLRGWQTLYMNTMRSAASGVRLGPGGPRATCGSLSKLASPRAGHATKTPMHSQGCGSHVRSVAVIRFIIIKSWEHIGAQYATYLTRVFHLTT